MLAHYRVARDDTDVGALVGDADAIEFDAVDASVDAYVVVNSLVGSVVAAVFVMEAFVVNVVAVVVVVAGK